MNSDQIHADVTLYGNISFFVNQNIISSRYAVTYRTALIFFRSYYANQQMCSQKHNMCIH